MSYILKDTQILKYFAGISFGQKQPPLTDLLKNILQNYPDGGQILKVSCLDDATKKYVVRSENESL